MRALQKLWYQKPIVAVLFLGPLLPFSFLFSIFVRLRRLCYRFGLLSQQRFAVPVIVVGNLTVGGTGKTPLVIHIVNLLKEKGLNPGIISRGYKGKTSGPTSVDSESNPLLVGDEPVLLAKRLGCPIVIGQNRCKALEQLLGLHKIDVVISDDGLQHYALHRHIEIAVIDGQRRFGNGLCLPAGPLREPKSRLKSVDLLITNGGIPHHNEYGMEYRPTLLSNALEMDHERLLSAFKGECVHAVAGIGNPHQFFRFLTSYGVKVIPHSFPDHHCFTPRDITFSDEYPTIMTEKDAVKCVEFVNERHWVLRIQAEVSPLFDARLLTLLQEVRYG